MALTSSGYVFTWGNSSACIFGHVYPNVKCFSIPCLVEGLRQHNVVQIAIGDYHCAVLVDPTNPSIIRQSQQASFNNKEHSDVVFMVENEPLYANVDVLSQKSDYFAAMFRSNMRENVERVVKIPNCSKAAFLCVLEYLYLDEFTLSINDANCFRKAAFTRLLEYLCLNDFTVCKIGRVMELWVLADMYQLEGLKYACMSALEKGLCKQNVHQVLQAAENLSCPCDELKRMCHEKLGMSS